MPDQPFSITAKDFEELVSQTQMLFDELYSERIAGAEIGDVFSIGDDDILALDLTTTPGLEKSSNALQVKIKSAGGITRDANGLSLTINWTSATSNFSTTGICKAGHFHGIERSSDPDEPAEGEFVIWMSDGTSAQAGVADGDVVCASKVGGATKVTIIHDHSAGGNWV